MGRPSFSGKPQDDRLCVRMSKEEKATLTEAAGHAGKSTSEWARDVLLAAARKRKKTK